MAETITLMNFAEMYGKPYGPIRHAFLMDQKPTLIGTVLGVEFYEHPEFGDEVGMLALVNGQLYKTDWYDLPRDEDILAL